ncbi:hypothetical protein PCANB_001153 [Pneumocystis canis]|nr:hypothetical protein PCANB_001153 [Pneumocystis canis]
MGYQSNCLQRFLIICSIGNPGPTYYLTRHNLGHYVLNEIRHYFGFSEFKKHSKDLGSYSENKNKPFLLFQSGVFMNESGQAIRQVWNRFCTNSTIQTVENPLLVIIHDDIEEKLGVLKVRKGGKSRGHKGIQSCIESLFPQVDCLCRPLTRASKDVSDFVLQKLSPQELEHICQTTIPKVIDEINKLIIQAENH